MCCAGDDPHHQSLIGHGRGVMPTAQCAGRVRANDWPPIKALTRLSSGPTKAGAPAPSRSAVARASSRHVWLFEPLQTSQNQHRMSSGLEDAESAGRICLAQVNLLVRFSLLPRNEQRASRKGMPPTCATRSCRQSATGRPRLARGHAPGANACSRSGCWRRVTAAAIDSMAPSTSPFSQTIPGSGSPLGKRGEMPACSSSG